MKEDEHAFRTQLQRQDGQISRLKEEKVTMQKSEKGMKERLKREQA